LGDSRINFDYWTGALGVPETIATR